MEARARIDRMERDGVITCSQADMLRQSLGSDKESPRQPGRRGLPIWAVITGLVVVGVGALIFATGGGDPVVQDVATSLNQPGGVGAMNKSLSTGLAILVLLIIPVVLWVWLHNSLVAKEEAVFGAWAQTESNYQRRADLIPALIDTVNRYLRHESETLVAVTENRSEAVASVGKAVEALIEAQKAASEQQQQFGAKILEQDEALAKLYLAQSRVGAGMTQLMGVVENYPELRSSDQFLELQAQLEGTENRINVTRMRFNDAVRDYNAAIRRLPASLIAQVGGFQRKAYFQSEEEARRAPELQFE